MSNVALTAFIFGAILTMIALVGGQFEIFGAAMPAVSNRLRVVAAITGTVLVFAGMYFSLITSPTATSSQSANQATSQNLGELKNQIDLIRKDVDQLKGQINSISQPNNQSATNIRLSKIDTDLTNVISKTTTLEQIIMQDPAKALEIPLLKKDMESSNKDLESNISSLKGDIERIYQLFFAFVIAMAISVLALAIGNLFQGKEKSK
jgi:hypothetical protein